MAKTPLFQGSCTAIVTPYTEHGIDYERLQKNLDFQYENGTAAIVVCGTTGEAATQNADEHNELVRFTVQAVAGRMKVIAGVGSNNTQTALRFAESAKGVISVASNIVPAVVAKLCALCLEGSYPEAMALFARYNALFGALFIETNPIPVKAAMKLLGTDSGFLRLPLTEISDEHLLKLKKIMQAVGLNV